MAMIRKNPVTTGIVSFAVLAILFIIIVLARRSSNNPKPTTKEGFSFSDTFSLSNMTDEDADHIGLGTGYQNDYEENEENEYQYNQYENEIVENFPQPAPMNVMYSDANGNLATTTDLGVEYLTVTRDSTVSGNSTVKGNSSVTGNSTLNGPIQANNRINFIATSGAKGVSLDSSDTHLRFRSGTDDQQQFVVHSGELPQYSRTGISIGKWVGDTNSSINADKNINTDSNMSAGGNMSTSKNLHTKRNRVCFSDTATDANHSIYNNYTNIDGEGGWDGMKMNTYAGLDVRTGNASGERPVTRLSVRNNGTLITSDSGEASNGFEYRHSNMTQGIGLGYNTIYATGSNVNQELNINSRGTEPVKINGRNILKEIDDLKTKLNNLLPAGDYVRVGPDLYAFSFWHNGQILLRVVSATDAEIRKPYPEFNVWNKTYGNA